MKKTTKLLAICLVLAMTASLFAGCDLLENKLDKLAGSWISVQEDSAEEARSALENIDMYEEEIALADLNSLKYVKMVTFHTDKTYSFSYDSAATRQCVYEFYEGFFADLYEKRDQLNELYGEDFTTMSQAEFFQYYADLYGAADYETMLNDFTDGCYDYEQLAEPFETGTFTIDGSDLMCKIDGEIVSEALGFKIDVNHLTLTYADGVEEYVKAG